ncbi:Arginine biosynthesis bifunctional protein ArgJ (Includes: Glutamate N-acetyltransferase; Amino-acid acetyltransferase) [Candidatus Sulfobium mesophilum]|uniref:Arginine biosynthesis bifunctional protein ArgJ n=1 Tax=Candidatus Sulfobium mesophilum TaxID=2016548 RepID=A0A2U3QFL4_9BACT|nr:Arginine biosynthesis bifunctional protein ArgJ (Includes: Glutamate N-acetyltransferase; Amino-acid acetyltransferase) [Candidatus Sulfobium mesophilum]
MPEYKSSLTPEGYLFSVAEAAVKKPGRKDIALIVSEVDAAIAGTFTTNAVKAAPVKLCMRNIRSGRGRTIFVNSGNANACTGARGLKDASEIASNISRHFRVKPSLSYVCSTGVIGVPLPMDRIIPTLGILLDNASDYSFLDVAKAIMTTDTFPKIASQEIKIGNKTGVIAGICKGAGMIEPHMATMLCFIITDIAVEQKTLQALLKDSVKRSFNRITIDGDMSTNDTVLLMANGILGNRPITADSKYTGAFKSALDKVTYELARLVVRDGEGATKLIEVVVKGARNETLAEKAAFAVANSNLMKTAIYGNDANWGRIMCALGYSGVPLLEEKIDIFFNGTQVVKGGLSNNKDKQATEALTSKEITITIDLHSGKSSVSVLTCDFTEEYVRINAEYRT